LAAVVMRWCEFRIVRGRSRAVGRITALDLRRADFGLLKDLGGNTWVRAVEGRGRSKRVGRYSSITCSLLKMDASP